MGDQLDENKGMVTQIQAMENRMKADIGAKLDKLKKGAAAQTQATEKRMKADMAVVTTSMSEMNEQLGSIHRVCDVGDQLDQLKKGTEAQIQAVEKRMKVDIAIINSSMSELKDQLGLIHQGLQALHRDAATGALERSQAQSRVEASVEILV